MPPLSESSSTLLVGDRGDAHSSIFDSSGFMSLSEDEDDASMISEQDFAPLVTQKNSKRGVHFCEHALLYEVDRIDEMYKEDCWLSYEEFIQIKGSCMDIVMKATRDTQICHEHDLRGLEHKTPQGMVKRQQAKKSSIGAVLEEQTYQSALGLKDADWLASVYREVATRSVVEAKIRGIRDEIAVKPEREIFYNDFRKFVCWVQCYLCYHASSSYIHTKKTTTCAVKQEWVRMVGETQESTTNELKNFNMCIKC